MRRWDVGNDVLSGCDPLPEPTLTPTDGTDATNYPYIPPTYHPSPTADSPAIRQELSDVIEAIPTIFIERVILINII